MENLEGFIGSIAFAVLQCGLKPDTKIELVVRKQNSLLEWLS